MVEHIGVVVQIETDGSARVAADRSGACGGCEPRGGGCHSCLSGISKMVRWTPTITHIVQSGVRVPAESMSTGKRASCCGK